MRKLTSGMLNEFLKNNSAISSKNLLLGLEIARQWRYVEGTTYKAKRFQNAHITLEFH